jgi:glycosyltransferase involved in cell wall biosynthesis
MTPPLRVAIVADLLEERWPSMDLVSEMLARHLGAGGNGLEVQLLRPPFVGRVGPAASPGVIDRLINRFHDYPRWLLSRRADFDLFHIADHSYAHLVHVLPADRSVVSCHDIDAFRTLIGDGRESDSKLPRFLTRRVLRGLQKAAHVLCDSRVTQQDLVDHRLIRSDRTQVVPLGVHPSCLEPSPPEAIARASELLATPTPTLDLLHVGSVIPRKRIDLLLRIIARVRGRYPTLRLVRVGGPLTTSQRDLASALGVADAVLTLPHLDRSTLAAVYRRAALVLLTSDREGFGLPIVEALACGVPVVATDLPVCREVGGAATSFCPDADVRAWTASIVGLLSEREHAPDDWRRRQAAARAHASAFTWSACAWEVSRVYERLAKATPSPVAGRQLAS